MSDNDAPAPAVQQLTAAFPSLEPSTIQAVVDAHGGSVEHATEALLGMSSPDYKPSESQIDSDAELARALAEEDAAARSASTRRQQQQQQPAQPQPLSYKPYVPKQRRNTNPNPADSTPVYVPPTERPKDELDQLSDDFKKLAEEGKKHATQFFSKVKAQIDKLDKPSSSSAQAAPAVPSKISEKPSNENANSIVPDLLPRPDSARPRSTSPNQSLSSDRAASTPTQTSTATQASTIPADAIPKNTTELTPAEPKKDFSKIGLLPRQQISLLDQKNANASAKKDDDEESEDLEYVRSPFDDD